MVCVTNLQRGHKVFTKWDISKYENPELLTTDKWEGFLEQPNLPAPETCVDTIEYAKKEENSAAVVYTYLLPDNQQSANQAYWQYQKLPSEICGLSCENRNDMVYISDDSGLISLMMAGKDPELGYFLQVSFPNSTRPET